MSRESELQANGCMAPEWFLRDHIPRFAEHYGVSIEDAYQSVLGEIVALNDVRNENFRQMMETGVAHSMLQIYAERGKLGDIGERPLTVIDNCVYMMKIDREDPLNDETTYYDPLNPLAIGNFHTMDDPIPTRFVGPINIGRPNSDGELWLAKGITVEDYDVIKDCFNRLLSLRTDGVTPHMQSTMDHISIPYTLGSTDYPYDPNDFYHGPVDYTGFATELKVAA